MTDPDLHPSIKRLETVLEKRGMKKNAFCELIDESTQNYNNWRSRGIPASKMLAAAQAIGVSREWLEGIETDTKTVNEQSATYLPVTQDVISTIIESTAKVMQILQKHEIADKVDPKIIGNMVSDTYANKKTITLKELEDNIVAFAKYAGNNN